MKGHPLNTTEQPVAWLPLSFWMRRENVTADHLLQGERHGLQLPVCDAAPGVVLVDTIRGRDWLALLHLEGIRVRRPPHPCPRASSPERLKRRTPPVEALNTSVAWDPEIAPARRCRKRPFPRSPRPRRSLDIWSRRHECEP